jgi:hypothetical protein
VESLLDRIKTWSKVETMPQIGFTGPKAFLEIKEGLTCSQFSICPSLCFLEHVKVSTERLELLDAFDKRFAVIRER